MAGLPKRLVLALDGIAYRDLKALQEGVTYTNLHGRVFHRQAFHRGYFPVSRMVSTFPSASDVAWTEVFGDRPLPGYQRTYFSAAANAQVAINPITTTMEYERQMTWQVESGLLRTLGYIFPRRTFKYEVQRLVRNFLEATDAKSDIFYALLRSPDDAQHLSADILAMLCTLDEALEKIRARYRAREGRELEILILSDHGNNHAGPAKRVGVRAFLKKAGYRLSTSIRHPKDVVLPTCGIESWVEIHNSPAETERLAELLSRMDGVDVLTAQDPQDAHRFLVMNSKAERATISWNPENNSFRYRAVTGDPIHYQPVVSALAAQEKLSANGFATADAWMAASIGHRYPLALERIVRGHTRAALNPATILISLDNAYVHAGWLVKRGSEVVRFGGTHGALDDLNSNGVLLSSFAPTRDTSASRVAALFNGFAGLRNYRAEECGAEWVSIKAQALTAIPRAPIDRSGDLLARGEIFLRTWTPNFAALPVNAPIEVTLKQGRRYVPARIRRSDPEPADPAEQRITLTKPVSLPGGTDHERVYALPSNLVLEPHKIYLISGSIRERDRPMPIFKFAFSTDSRSRPIPF
jgi:hypothetical protein